MSDFLTHETKGGERWDTLANLYYGDPLLMEPIMRANPDQLSKVVLEGGLTIKIPILDEPTAPLAAPMPPWIRS